MKKALITGITGQDSSYLAEFLLEKGYEVHGIKRRASQFNTRRVDHLCEDPHVENSRFRLHYGDLADSSNLTRLISEIQPDEVYNLAAQSHVAVSFEAPEYAAEVETLLGDPSKARAMLGWVPEIGVEEMCAEMVAADLDTARSHALLKANGHSVSVSRE